MPIAAPPKKPFSGSRVPRSVSAERSRQFLLSASEAHYSVGATLSSSRPTSAVQSPIANAAPHAAMRPPATVMCLPKRANVGIVSPYLGGGRG